MKAASSRSSTRSPKKIGDVADAGEETEAVIEIDVDEIGVVGVAVGVMEGEEVVVGVIGSEVLAAIVIDTEAGPEEERGFEQLRCVGTHPPRCAELREGR